MNAILIISVAVLMLVLILLQWMRRRLLKAEKRLHDNDRAYYLLSKLEDKMKVYTQEDVIAPEKGFLKFRNNFRYDGKRYFVTANVAISELAEEQEHPLEYEKLKEVFISNMGHGMRTSLQGIVGFSSLLVDEADFATIKTYAHEIRSNSELMLRLVNDMINRSMNDKIKE